MAGSEIKNRHNMNVPFSIKYIPSVDNLSCDKFIILGSRVLYGPAVGPVWCKNKCISMEKNK